MISLWCIFTLLRTNNVTRRCQYCKQFTPKFEQIAKNDKVHGVTYAKMDGPAYKNIT